MERKGLQIKNVTEEGTGQVVFATLEVKDKDGDVTLPGFFGEQDVHFIPKHIWHDARPPLGDVHIYEVKDEAIGDYSLNLDTELGREWHSHFKRTVSRRRVEQEFSYGFDILPGGQSSGEFEGEPVRFLQPLEDGRPGSKVYEVSPVILAAGERTRILDAKGQLRFADELSEVCRIVAAAIDRANAILKLRKDDGRGLSRGRVEQLAELEQALWELQDQTGDLRLILAANQKQAIEPGDFRATPFADLPIVRDEAWNPGGQSDAQIIDEITHDREDWEPMKQAHLAYAPGEDRGGDPPTQDNAYRLKIARRRGEAGRLTVIFRQLASRVAILNGARGGVDIPLSAKRGAFRHAMRYYEKLEIPQEDRPSMEFSSRLIIEEPKDVAALLAESNIAITRARMALATLT